MSFPKGTIVNEQLLFPPLPSTNIAPIRPVENVAWGKDDLPFFYSGVAKFPCPKGLVWKSSGKACAALNPKPAERS
jgi:hypothetical protein